MNKNKEEKMLKPKKYASVIPPKRKLVKTMMFEAIVQSCSSLCPASEASVQSGNAKNKKGKEVYPITHS